MKLTNVLITKLQRKGSMQGVYVQGVYVQGVYVQGVYVQGVYVQGVYVQGVYVQGVYVQGVYVQQYTYYQLLLAHTLQQCTAISGPLACICTHTP